MYKKYSQKAAYLCRKKMYSITDDHYLALAENLLAVISNADFYNGTVEMSDNGYNVSFRATLIIKRTPKYDPIDHTQTASVITDIIPVWWEHHLYDSTGERLTDFDWREMKNFLT